MRKIMEFLNLLVKPLDAHLGSRLARSLADSPGLFGESWNRTLGEYFNEVLPKRLEKERKLDGQAVQDQYSFWFRRRRYAQDGRVPKAEVRAIFNYLRNWVRGRMEELKGPNLVAQQLLAAQAGRLVELIDLLPETELSYLEVERLVRSVYAPAPAQFRAEEKGRWDTAYHPAAVNAPVAELIWWDFVEQIPNYFFSRWTPSELEHLEAQQIKLLQPHEQNDTWQWQQQRPLFYAQQRLILCLPAHTNGEEALPHALLGDLEATFGKSLTALTVDVDSAGAGQRPLLGAD
ncbi:MAG: hypothetical protein HC821_00235 [Lewinella sp.]|nr:hypothetical protein [Lewinella sp.]